MARRPLSPGERGFSLVEMLVALLFTGILLAGMAGVFRSSISTFYTAGEKLSSLRRNRGSIDLLYDDLNAAGMWLGDLVNPPGNLTNAAVPGFFILPGQPIANPDAVNGPTTADELYFCFDQPLQFQGKLVLNPGAPQRNAAQLVQLAAAPGVQDRTYKIDCLDPAYAALVKPGQYVNFMDAFEAAFIDTVTVAGTVVTITTKADPASLITGIGPTGAPARTVHVANGGMVFYTPGQMVRYSIQMKALDPAGGVGIPCLVRDQGTYDPNGFTAAAPQQVVTENVSNFKVMLSADSGQTWAGWDTTRNPPTYKTYSTPAVGATLPSRVALDWSGGLQADLNSQLAAVGRPGFKDTSSPSWFRSIPTLVRVDIQTRTASQRSEYSPANTALAYGKLTQTLVIVPRHFGLSLK